MRIRTRLFLGTAGLVMALVTLQWWWHVRHRPSPPLRRGRRGRGQAALTPSGYSTSGWRAGSGSPTECWWSATVMVVDRGPGLPAEVRERLFSPHLTTKVGGAGMGLFLARQLVVGMHAGSLEVADRDGGGTAITLLLPLDGGVDEAGHDA